MQLYNDRLSEIGKIKDKRAKEESDVIIKAEELYSTQDYEGTIKLLDKVLYD